MAKHNIIVPASFVKAAASFASNDTTRPILGGIHFVNEDGKLVLVCTDGYRLIVCETGESAPDFEPFTLPAKALSKVKAVKSSAFGGQACYIIDVDNENYTASVTGDLETWTSIRLVEGKYPAFRNILPKGGESFTVEPTCVNPAFMADACKAFATIDKNAQVTVATRTHKATILEGKGDGYLVTALVMPVRADNHAFDKYEAAPKGDADTAKRIAQLEAERDKLTEDYVQVCKDFEELEADKQYWMEKAERYEDMAENYHLMYEKLAQDAQDERPHEWESKTLLWFDHEVEGATRCTKKGSRNYGNWFIKKQ